MKATSQNDEARKKVQEAINTHWQLNEWEEKTSQRVETLNVEGEWDYWVGQPNRYNGHYKIHKLLPEIITEIERSRTDAETLTKVHFAGALEFDLGGQSFAKSEMDIVRRNFMTGRITGEVLHLGINRLSGQTRGWSDLIVVADYLDALESLLLGEVDRAKLQRSFIWEIILRGSDVKAREERKRKLLQEGPPEPASLIIRDESEEWNPKAPALNLQESIAFLEFLLSIIFGGLNMPQHFFSQGGDVNKATASEMGGPVWSLVRDRKRQIMAFLRLEVELALQILLERGFLGNLSPADLSFEVISRDPERNSYNLIGQMLGELEATFASGVEHGFLTHQDAGRSLRNACSQLGLGDFAEPDPADLAAAREQIGRKMEAERSQLQDSYPLQVKDPGLPEAA